MTTFFELSKDLFCINNCGNLRNGISRLCTKCQHERNKNVYDLRISRERKRVLIRILFPERKKRKGQKKRKKYFNTKERNYGMQEVKRL